MPAKFFVSFASILAVAVVALAVEPTWAAKKGSRAAAPAPTFESMQVVVVSGKRPSSKKANLSGSNRSAKGNSKTKSSKEKRSNQRSDGEESSGGLTEAVPTTKIPVTNFEAPVTVFQQKATALFSNPAALEEESIDTLEALANEALLSRVSQVMSRAATQDGWQSTQGLRLLSLENLMSNSANEVPATFNPNGFRLATFAMRRGNNQRGIILTSTFQSTAPGELRGLYREGKILPGLDASEAQIRDFAVDLAKRLLQGESRRSRYIPVQGAAAAWKMACDETIAGRFCLSAQFFDTGDTDFTVLVDGLEGTEPTNSLISQIREMKLTWPISRTFISRGYKACVCRAEHFGLDMTAPIGTAVRAVADGVVRNVKGYSGWGRTLVIEHVLPSGEKFISLYAHLSKYRKDLKVGDIIKRGEIVAQTGNSGSSKGPHLHLEIRNAPDGKEPLQQPRTRADNPLDPMRVLDIFNLFVEGENSATP